MSPGIKFCNATLQLLTRAEPGRKAFGIPGAVLLGRDGAPGDEIVAVAFTFRVVGGKCRVL